MLIIQSSCPAQLPSTKCICMCWGIDLHSVFPVYWWRGRFKKKKKIQGMKLSTHPSWVLIFHLLCWISQPEEKNILKSCKPLTAFTCHASGPVWPLVPSLLPKKTAPPHFHPASCWQETQRNRWCTQKTTGLLQLAPPHLLNSAFSPQSHAAPLTSEPW